MNIQSQETSHRQEEKPGLDSERSGQRLWMSLACLAIAMYYIAFARPYFGPNSDAVTYLTGARSLAAGHGYRFEVYPGMPPIGLYPPGNSLLFTPVAWICHTAESQGVGCLALLGAVTLVGACFAIEIQTRLGLPPWLAALATMSLATSPHWFMSATSLGSDAPFALFVWLACWWWLRHWKTLTLRSLLPIAAFLFMAQLFRSAGLALYIGLITAELALNRQRVRWSVPVLAGSLLAASAVRRWMVPAEAVGYQPLLLRKIELEGGMHWYLHKVLENASTFVSGIQFHELLWPVGARSPQIAMRVSNTVSQLLSVSLVLVWLVFFSLMVLAGLRLWKSRSDTTPLCTLILVLGATIGMLLVLPTHSSHFTRYLLWAFPVVAAGVWRSVCTAVPAPRQPLLALTAGLTLGAVTASNAWVSFSILRTSTNDYRLDEAKAFVEQIRPRLNQEATIAVSGTVPFVHMGEWLGRPLFGEYYQLDLTKTPPGLWSDRAKVCTFVITHSRDRLEDLAAASGWTQEAHSEGGTFVLYRTRSGQP